MEACGQELGNGSMRMGAWGWEHGDGTVRLFFWLSFVIFFDQDGIVRHFFGMTILSIFYM